MTWCSVGLDMITVQQTPFETIAAMIADKRYRCYQSKGSNSGTDSKGKEGDMIEFSGLF